MFTFKVLKRFRKAFGQWAMATPQRPNKCSTVKPRLEWLEERWCPAGGPGNSDTLIWEPLNNSQNPGVAMNWFDQNAGKAGVTIPASSNPVIFDGSLSNSAITWGPMTVKTMTLRNGYTALMTMTAPTMTDAGTFSEDAKSTLNMYFNDKAIFQIGGGGNITNMTLSGYPSGQLQLTGGTMEIAQSPGYTETTGVNILVDGGTLLQDDGYTPLKFTNSYLTLSVKGTMKVFYGTGSGLTLIDRNGFSNDLIDVNGGNLIYLGNGGVADAFDMNVWVENGGNFYVMSATDAYYGAKLTVKGTPGAVSVYLTGATSSVELDDAATLECDNGYTQDSGILETTDATTCTLIVGNGGGGTANITGGNVSINTSDTGYGELDVKCSTLNFAGTLNVSIQGNASNSCDVLNVSGTLNLNNGSALYVGVNGSLVGGNSWTVIYSSTQLANDFSSTNNSETGLHSTLKPDGSYMLSF